MADSIILFLDISGGEFLIIMLVAFFVFGPKKLPEIARKIGRTMNEIKSVSGELTKEFRDETRNISNELRTARDSARINTTLNNDIETITAENLNDSQPYRKKIITLDKPADEVSVIKENDNNVPAADVKSELKNSQ